MLVYFCELLDGARSVEFPAGGLIVSVTRNAPGNRQEYAGTLDYTNAAGELIARYRVRRLYCTTGDNVKVAARNWLRSNWASGLTRLL